MQHRTCKHKKVEYAVKILFLCADTVDNCAERIHHAARNHQNCARAVEAFPKRFYCDNNHPAKRQLQHHLHHFGFVKKG